MNKLSQLLLLTISVSFVGCGGGGSTGTQVTTGTGDVINIENTTYSCAPGASSKDSFIVPDGNPDYQKDTGTDLISYFSPFSSLGNNNFPENSDEKEVRNSYLTLSAKTYYFGEPGSFAVENVNSFTLQSLLGEWYSIEEESENSKKIKFSYDNDIDDPESAFSIFSSIDLLLNIRNSPIAFFADIGDPVMRGEINELATKKYCAFTDKFLSKDVNGITYQDVIELSCTTITGQSVFIGQKIKLLLAREVGVISQLTDQYLTVIENTQETNRRCFQGHIVATESKLVNRAYIDELRTLVP